MAKINDTVTFPNTVPEGADFVIGTDVSDTGTSPDGEVVTFAFDDIKDFILSNVGLGAFERLTAGNTTRSQAVGVSVSSASGDWVTVHSFGFMQIGSVRCIVQSGSGSPRQLRLVRRRAGVNTVVSGPITNTILSVDISVLPGDGLSLQVQGTTTPTTWQGDFLTNGGNLWPGSVSDITGNTY